MTKEEAFKIIKKMTYEQFAAELVANHVLRSIWMTDVMTNEKFINIMAHVVCVPPRLIEKYKKPGKIGIGLDPTMMYLMHKYYDEIKDKDKYKKFINYYRNKLERFLTKILACINKRGGAIMLKYYKDMRNAHKSTSLLKKFFMLLKKNIRH